MPWQPHPDAWLLAIALLGGYLYALAAWGPKEHPGGRTATSRQRWSFFAGTAVLWLASDWPLHSLSTELFSAHMLQHMLYSFVAAPLLIRGTPGWLLRRLLRPRAVAAVMRFVTKPLIALVVFNAWVVAYHTPALVNLSVSNELAHFAMHIAWVAAGIVMWWPVLSPLQELPHLSAPLAMVYLFGQSIIPTGPASFLTFAETSLYSAYATSTTAWGLPAVWDQQLAGLLMKLGGGALLWGSIVVMFFRWAKREEQGAPDPLYWEDMEPAVERARTP
jgi:putative membrane protein